MKRNEDVKDNFAKDHDTETRKICVILNCFY